LANTPFFRPLKAVAAVRPRRCGCAAPTIGLDAGLLVEIGSWPVLRWAGQAETEAVCGSVSGAGWAWPGRRRVRL